MMALAVQGPQGGVTPDPLGLQYTADGRKLREGRLVSAKRPALSQGVSTQSSWAVVGATLMERFDAPTDYSGNLVYKSGVLDKVLFDGGYISAADTSYHFFITDHQGNVRVVADASGAVEQVTHYGPFGEDLGDSAASLPVGAQDSVGNPYKYGGKEWDSALGLYDFSARLYRPAAARFTTMDPLCEKYYSISPYAYCANNPVNLVDPDGARIWIWANGTQEYILYSQRELFNKDGTEYSGEDKFVLLIQATLNNLYDLNDEYISEVLDNLEESDMNHGIAFDEKYTDSVEAYGFYGKDKANRGEPVGTWIKLSFKRRNADGVDLVPATILSHEIKHSYDFDSGKMKGLVPWRGEGINPAEISAVNFENRVRVRLRLPIRKRYGAAIPSNMMESPWKKKTDKK